MISHRRADRFPRGIGRGTGHNGFVPSSEPDDPGSAIGRRVRDQRVKSQLSQTQLAEMLGLSGSYLSLIEAGRRTPGSGVLGRIADALGCSTEYLLAGRGGTNDIEADLNLRFAEMALRSGDADEAHRRFSEVARSASDRGLADVQLEARWGLARAAETLGSLEAAIPEYEALFRHPVLPDVIDRAAVATALCRAYHECGDLSRAVDIGEQALKVTRSEGLTSLADASIALSSTLAGCYMDRGDLTRAALLIEEALTKAQENGSPQARAAALWNASLISEARGDLRTARSHIERALALYGETDNARATALVKVAAAWVMVRQAEPRVDEAEALLRQALSDLPVVGSVLDVAYAETELGRCYLLRGEWQACASLVQGVIERLANESARLEATAARLLLANAALVGAETATAMREYSKAADEMRASGAHRHAAAAWRELGEGLARLGRTEEALEAYRAASDAAGVAAPSPYFAQLTHNKSAAATTKAANHRQRQRSPR